MLVVAVALELEHAVDEVLENARPGDGSVLRHVPDQDRRDPASFATRRRRPAASRTCATDPGAEPISDAYRVCTESITHTSGRSRSMVAHTASSSVSARMLTSSAPPSLAARSETCAGRLLPGHEQRPLAGARDRAEDAEEKRRLPHSRLTGDEHDRGRNEAATKNAVELRHGGRQARNLACHHLAERHRRPRLGSAGSESPSPPAPRRASRTLRSRGTCRASGDFPFRIRSTRVESSSAPWSQSRSGTRRQSSQDRVSSACKSGAGA